MTTNKKEPGIYLYSNKNGSNNPKLFYLKLRNSPNWYVKKNPYSKEIDKFIYYLLEDFDKLSKINKIYTKDKDTGLPVASFSTNSPRYLECVLIEATDIIPTVAEAKTKYPEHYI
jgi:hypothetical protein